MRKDELEKLLLRAVAEALGVDAGTPRRKSREKVVRMAAYRGTAADNRQDAA